MGQNPKAKRGYCRDGRADCLQLVIALVLTPEGFPLAYQVMNGNTSDRAMLPGLLKNIENTNGKTRSVWVMISGHPLERALRAWIVEFREAILNDMRTCEGHTFYLVGTSKGNITQHER